MVACIGEEMCSNLLDHTIADQDVFRFKHENGPDLKPSDLKVLDDDLPIRDAGNRDTVRRFA